MNRDKPAPPSHLSRDRTFVSLLGLSQVDLGDGFEVGVPQSDAAVSAARGEALLAGIHAEDTGLRTHTHAHNEATMDPRQPDVQTSVTLQR